MDVLLPSDETMQRMRDEYAKLGVEKKTTSAMSYINNTLSDFAKPTSPRECDALWFLILYIVFALGYNFGYGTQIYDPHGSVGWLQSDKRAFGELNNLF